MMRVLELPELNLCGRPERRRIDSPSNMKLFRSCRHAAAIRVPIEYFLRKSQSSIECPVKRFFFAANRFFDLRLFRADFGKTSPIVLATTSTSLKKNGS